jgi:hypothetical protein
MRVVGRHPGVRYQPASRETNGSRSPLRTAATIRLARHRGHRWVTSASKEVSRRSCGVACSPNRMIRDGRRVSASIDVIA